MAYFSFYKCFIFLYEFFNSIWKCVCICPVLYHILSLFCCFISWLLQKWNAGYFIVYLLSLPTRIKNDTTQWLCFFCFVYFASTQDFNFKISHILSFEISGRMYIYVCHLLSLYLCSIVTFIVLFCLPAIRLLSYELRVRASVSVLIFHFIRVCTQWSVH